MSFLSLYFAILGHISCRIRSSVLLIVNGCTECQKYKWGKGEFKIMTPNRDDFMMLQSEWFFELGVDFMAGLVRGQIVIRWRLSMDFSAAILNEAFRSPDHKTIFLVLF